MKPDSFASFSRIRQILLSTFCMLLVVDTGLMRGVRGSVTLPGYRYPNKKYNVPTIRYINNTVLERDTQAL